MHDDTPEGTHGPGPDNGVADYAAADEAVGRVIRWYATQIRDARAAAADGERLRRLLEDRAQCVADRGRLEHADPAEVARIAADYEARWRELREG